MRDSLSPACVSASSSSNRFLLFFLRLFSSSSSSSPQPFSYSSCSPYRHFPFVTIVAVKRRLSGKVLLLLQPPLLSWRGACREKVARCIEEVSVKSNVTVHRRGSFVTVYHRGKLRNHVVSTIVVGVRLIW